MKEYRVCETCEHPNDVSFLECESCGADLSFVSPSTVEEQHGKPRINESAQVPEVRLPPDSIVAEPRIAEAGARTLRMTSLRLISTLDGIEIEIPWSGGLLGREGTIRPDYFARYPFVSNRHAQIEVREAGYVIIDKNSTNGTRINGVRLESEREYTISNEDRLVLANLEFTVRS